MNSQSNHIHTTSTYLHNISLKNYKCTETTEACLMSALHVQMHVNTLCKPALNLALTTTY